ncbi:8162_t:CDS:2 [Funneliformis geosporum]|nr:8162_t:CDS:2 [Funneliformis geosporum]
MSPVTSPGGGLAVTKNMNISIVNPRNGISLGFLTKCDLEPFQRKIDCYLKCLDTIFESEHVGETVAETSQCRVEGRKYFLLKSYSATTVETCFYSRRSFHNSLSGVTRTYLVACHSRLIAEPQNWCQGTSDLLGCLMFWWDREPKTDCLRARGWDQERSRKQVHINQPIVATVHGDGNITNIGDGNGGTIVSSKRDKEESEYVMSNMNIQVIQDDSDDISSNSILSEANSRPIHNEDSFIKMIKKFDLCYHIPSHYYIKSHIVNQFQLRQEKLNYDLQKIQDIIRFHESHSSANISETLLSLMVKYNLTTKVLALTTDNDSAMIACDRKICDELSTKFNNSLFSHYHYDAHILNLAIQHGLQVYDEVIGKVCNFINKVKKSNLLIEDLQRIFELQNLPYLGSQIDLETC